MSDVVRRSREAAPAGNGYHYQRQYALYLMSSSDWASIVEEGHEDIDMTLKASRGNSKISIQVKYYNSLTSSENMTNERSGLYKVLTDPGGAALDLSFDLVEYRLYSPHLTKDKLFNTQLVDLLRQNPPVLGRHILLLAYKASVDHSEERLRAAKSHLQTVTKEAASLARRKETFTNRLQAAQLRLDAANTPKQRTTAEKSLNSARLALACLADAPVPDVEEARDALTHAAAAAQLPAINYGRADYLKAEEINALFEEHAAEIEQAVHPKLWSTYSQPDKCRGCLARVKLLPSPSTTELKEWTDNALGSRYPHFVNSVEDTRNIKLALIKAVIQSKLMEAMFDQAGRPDGRRLVRTNIEAEISHCQEAYLDPASLSRELIIQQLSVAQRLARQNQPITSVVTDSLALIPPPQQAIGYLYLVHFLNTEVGRELTATERNPLRQSLSETCLRALKDVSMGDTARRAVLFRAMGANVDFKRRINLPRVDVVRALGICDSKQQELLKSLKQRLEQDE